MAGRGQPQIRLDPDVVTSLDDERGDDSRAQFANWLLRNALRTTPDMHQQPPPGRSLAPLARRRPPPPRVRPTPYRR